MYNQSMNNKSQYTALLALLGIIIVLGVVGLLVYQKSVTYQPQSTLNLGPTTAPKKASAEPPVDTWKTYNNDKYNFAIGAPDTWQQQEYDQNGGMLVAFGPNSLPCVTCSYLKNGYFSVKIFNQKSDPDYYKAFQAKMSNIGKTKDYQGITLGKDKGVMTSNTIDIEDRTWVYELSLDANGGNEKISDSKIFQKAMSSFKFTGLIFDN